MTGLLLLLQAAIVTVGDTLRVERSLGPLGPVVVRPQSWSLGALGQQLGPAEVVPGSTGITVRYALVLWYPGEHQLTMPGPVVVGRDGRSDTLPASTVRVRVASVLPREGSRAALDPRPPGETLPLESRSPLPVLLLPALVALGLVPLALRWRRRGAPPARPAAVTGHPGPEILARWAAAGEYRAALEGWGWVLAKRLAASRDLRETAEIQQVLDAISYGAFAPRPEAALAELCARAARLAGS